jgi:hypothetical protein
LPIAISKSRTKPDKRRRNRIKRTLLRSTKARESRDVSVNARNDYPFKHPTSRSPVVFAVTTVYPKVVTVHHAVGREKRYGNLASQVLIRGHLRQDHP